MTRSFDPQTGRVLDERPLRGRPGDVFIDFTSALHFGDILTGTPFDDAEHVLWIALGLIPGTLGVTGLMVYWNRYLRAKIQNARRQRNPTHTIA